MHPSILAQRKAKAMDRILQAARVIDPARAEALQPKGVKDPAAAEMMRLEAIADLLDGLRPPFEAAVVTAVTAPPEDQRPIIADFPAHVVEPPAEEELDEEEELFEEKPKRKPARRTKK